MSSLKERLRSLIAATGPISVSDYMATCLFDPQSGYYTTRQPFGADGDFTTSPEISQMFGELVAVWAYSAWKASGKPVPVTLAEIGPGRGTLMADMLRTLDRLDPAFIVLARFALIETSPRLTEIQQKKLAASGRARPTWLTGIEQLGATPLILIANELFDAIPIRQFVKGPDGWRERMVGLDEAGELAFMAGAGGLDPALLPPGAEQAPDGSVFEIAPARSALMDLLSQHIKRHGGAALIFDYGHLQPGVADTLQAMRRHAYDDVFAHPGEADLTSHVDFAALSEIARKHGLSVRSTTQGDFLLGMGLLERAGALGANASPEVRENLRRQAERLAGPDGMGELFKVMIVSREGVGLPPGIGTD